MGLSRDPMLTEQPAAELVAHSTVGTACSPGQHILQLGSQGLGAVY